MSVSGARSPKGHYKTDGQKIGVNSEGIIAYKDLAKLRKRNRIGKYEYVKRIEEVLRILKIDASKYPKDTTIPVYIAMCYDELGRKEDAEEVYKKLINEKDKNSFVHFRYGKLLVKYGRLNEAQEQFKKCKEKDGYAHLELGKIYLKKKNFPGAKAEFEACIRINPKDRFAYYSLAQALIYNGDEESLIEEALLKHLELNPEDHFALCDLGERRRKQGRLDEAKENLDRSIKLSPNDIYAHHELGMTFRDMQDYENAMREFRKCIEIAETTSEKSKNKQGKEKRKVMHSYYELGRLCRINGNLEEAERLLMKSLIMAEEDNEKKYYIHYELGLTYMEMNEVEKAIFEFETYIKEYKEIRKRKEEQKGQEEQDEQEEKENQTGSLKLMYATYDLSRLYRKMGYLSQAEKYINDSLSIYNGDKPGFLHLERGKIYEEMYFQSRDESFLDKAKKEFEECINNDKEPLEYGYIEQGLLYKKTGDTIKAREMFRKYNEVVGHKKTHGYMELALLSLFEGENKLAEELFKTCIGINPNEVYSHLYLGELYLDAKKYEEAENEFNKGIECSPNEDNPLVYLDLGQVLAIKNGDENALSFYCSLIKDSRNLKSVVQQITKQLEDNKKEEKSRVFNKNGFNDTLKDVKSSLLNGEYQFIKGYSCDFYIVKEEKCGYLRQQEDKKDLDYVLVCTYPDSKKIIAVVPISGIEELGKQGENIQITPANVKDVISKENRELSTKTIQLREGIADTIGKYIDMINLAGRG